MDLHHVYVMYYIHSRSDPEGVRTNLQRTFGTRLSSLRKQAGMSQEELSERTGISTQHISNIEHGHREICLANIGKLAKTFGLTLSELLKDV
jgi:transcriptional regulator with XRE-family HTH domain